MNAVTATVREASLKPLTRKTLNYLRTRGALTPLVFWSTYGSMALAQQVHELRKAGFKVKTTMKHDDADAPYPSYSLEAA